jgi:putative transposase
MTSKPLYKVPIGAQLVFDNTPWLVVGKDKNSYAVEGVDDGECTSLSVDWVQSAIATNRCEVIKPAQLQKQTELAAFTDGYTLVEQLPKDEQANIRARLSLVSAVEKLEAEGHRLTQRFLSRKDIRERLVVLACQITGDQNQFHTAQIGSTRTPFDVPKGRTLMEMLTRFRHFDRNPVSLMHRHHLKGPPEHLRGKLSTIQEQFIQYVLNLWMNGKKPLLAPLWVLAKTQFVVPEEAYLQGFVFPSVVTVRTRLKAITAVVKSIGRNGVKFAANLMGAGSTDVRALIYGERGATDQVYLSIFINGKGDVAAREIDPKKVEEELKPKEIRRVWLSFMLDVATRMPLAWVISETPDADHSMALLRMASRDKTKEKVRYGCKSDPAPAVSLMLTTADNGTATRNATVYAGQLGVGTSVVTSRTYHSTDNTYAERPFGTMQFQVLNFERGYTGSRPGELPDEDPMANANLNADELYGSITRYFIDEYPHKEHRGTGMNRATPKQKLRDVLKVYGGIDAPSPRERRLHLGMKKDVSTTSEGINFLKIPYNSTELQKFHAGKPKKVTVHLDPDYLQEVIITVEGSAKEIIAKLQLTALQDQTLQEALELMSSAVKADPLLKEIDDQCLHDAISRRAKASGFFPDSRDPSSYGRMDYLEKKADELANVEVRPSMAQATTVLPGGIMNRSGGQAVYQTTEPSDDPPPHEPRQSRQMFSPNKKSKL